MNFHGIGTLYPSRLTITPSRNPSTIRSMYNTQLDNYLASQRFTQAIENFKVKNNPFILSKASKRKIFDSINSMFCLSKPRHIAMKNGKKLPNFQLAFITLTLPSAQKHSDLQIKSDCLNQILVELAKHYNVKNFVWKAELQKNENIHFHLITDQYIDYQALRRRWNRVVNKLGYVDAFSSKMMDQSLMQYHANRLRYAHTAIANGNNIDAPTFKDSSVMYAAGRACGWRNPNSVDVRTVSDKKDLAIYLSKYIAKDLTESDMDDDLLARSIAFGRSWSRSYSLAKLKYQNKFDFASLTNVIEYFKSCKHLVKKVSGDFFTVYYFTASELGPIFRKFHSRIMFANAKLHKYPIPI